MGAVLGGDDRDSEGDHPQGGGILVEPLNSLGLRLDQQAGDSYLFFTSTSWMAWNYLVGGLLHGATIVLYEGSPSHQSGDALWAHARDPPER